MTKDDPARAARLAEALRANLKRRKAQARETRDGADRPSGAGEAAAQDPDGS